jgi:hypothetical protein
LEAGVLAATIRGDVESGGGQRTTGVPSQGLHKTDLLYANQEGLVKKKQVIKEQVPDWL